MGKLTVCRSGDITVFVEYSTKLNYIFNSIEEHNSLLVKIMSELKEEMKSLKSYVDMLKEQNEVFSRKEKQSKAKDRRFPQNYQ